MDENNISISLSSIIDDQFNNSDFNNYVIQYHGPDLTGNIKNKIWCSNCGKYGHVYKKCSDPITSIGIINLYLTDLKLDTLFMNKYVIKNVVQKYKQNNYHIKNIYLNKFNDKNNNSILKDVLSLNYMDKYLDIVKNKLKILMIRRKNTVGYIEFIRGRYNERDDKSILFLLNQMTHEEINFLRTHKFEEIWSILWNGKYDNLPIDQLTINNMDSLNEEQYHFNLEKLTSKDKYIYLKVHLKEYTLSNNKFKYLNENNIFDRLEQHINILYEQPEWGFPKGRRNIHEKNIDCALREFEEESGISGENIDLMDRIYPLNEMLIGTNNLNYKHSYYLSIGKLEDINLDLPSQKIEIGGIGWFTYNEAKNMIRPYHVNRIKILDEIILFIAHNLRYYASYNSSMLE
jgi:8-oxo-dGTP pyrophosphatase MutT (NUDIX family)